MRQHRDSDDPHAQTRRVRGKQARGDYDREKAFDLQHWSELKGGLPEDLQKAIEEAERRRKAEGG